jgi:hypothetical protein
MTKFLFTLLATVLLLANTMSARCQELAITQSGDSIYIYNNGTWSYEILDEMPEMEEDKILDYLSEVLKIDTVSGKIAYPDKTNKVLKNVSNQFTIKYDDKKWKRVPPASLNDAAEFALEAKFSEIYCIVISEETEITQENLFKIAKNSLEENSGSTIEVLKTESRNVNGADVIRGTFKTDFSGITFIFDSYYFSNELGSVQFTVWSSDNVWRKREKEILDLLNGFIVK